MCRVEAQNVKQNNVQDMDTNKSTKNDGQDIGSHQNQQKTNVQNLEPFPLPPANKKTKNVQDTGLVLQYSNVTISEYHNMLITRTEIHSFLVLITLFDTVFKALFNYGSHRKRPLQKTHVLQICSYP